MEGAKRDYMEGSWARFSRTLSDADGELRLTGLWPLTAPLYFVADERSFRHGEIDLRSGFLDLGTVLFDPHAGPSITGRVLGADVGVSTTGVAGPAFLMPSQAIPS